MSVILRNSEGKILLYCKGADNFLFDRMKKDCAMKKETEDHLTRYANTGLRTLVVGAREIPEEEYIEWLEKYLKVKALLKGRKEKMMEV